jgi:hypothetical protein
MLETGGEVQQRCDFAGIVKAAPNWNPFRILCCTRVQNNDTPLCGEDENMSTSQGSDEHIIAWKTVRARTLSDFPLPPEIPGGQERFSDDQ